MQHEKPHKHENKTCPRCGAGFICKAGTILQCQCYGIELPPGLQETIMIRYQDCLCRTCLEELASGKSIEKA